MQIHPLPFLNNVPLRRNPDVYLADATTAVNVNNDEAEDEYADNEKFFDPGDAFNASNATVGVGAEVHLGLNKN